MAYSKLENGLKYTLMIRLFWFFRSGMNKLVYIVVPNQFVIGDVFLKLLIKRLAVAMVNKTVRWYCFWWDLCYRSDHSLKSWLRKYHTGSYSWVVCPAPTTFVHIQCISFFQPHIHVLKDLHMLIAGGLSISWHRRIRAHTCNASSDTNTYYKTDIRSLLSSSRWRWRRGALPIVDVWTVVPASVPFVDDADTINGEDKTVVCMSMLGIPPEIPATASVTPWGACSLRRCEIDDDWCRLGNWRRFSEVPACPLNTMQALFVSGYLHY
jgi:hypothetical protein